ncbi:MAG TPA: queuosine precursor transporter [Cytophagaceae bacterium]|nr:queuosine precursor transporter [Cytophagaceae bacterium]
METNQFISQDKKQHLYIILSAFFLTNALIAEMIGTKLFSVEGTLGLPPAAISLFEDFPLSFNMTAGVVLWPFVFIITDIINEYFGKEGVKKISYITSGLISYAFFMIWIAIQLAPSTYWMEINNKDSVGNFFNVNYAFSAILGQGLNIIIASLFAFLVGQILDAYLFEYIKGKTGDKYLWLRSTGSTFFSQLIDSFLVLFVAFYLLPAPEKKWSMALVLSVGIINYIYKVTMAVLLTPLIYMAHTLIDRYLGVKKA